QRADIGPLELNVAREPDRDGAGCGETALETGEDLIERAKAAGEQAMRVPILRRAGARSGGCRQRSRSRMSTCSKYWAKAPAVARPPIPAPMTTARLPSLCE